jgi:hypothetical protein
LIALTILQVGHSTFIEGFPFLPVTLNRPQIKSRQMACKVFVIVMQSVPTNQAGRQIPGKNDLIRLNNHPTGMLWVLMGKCIFKIHVIRVLPHTSL